ncbi:uncharacterized protein Z519_10591 [Cladophialophora bantiana CBS 173.52]|uniref:Uncharacterized protein n=1 Tax=Cladophialophora bantiana (strain ATCC 10958 / CBS 173.52 / CDC B-1940 / NIH 8579) TaxID=1442370 RepID=A0A0D2HCC9_CLAB1|nr:uncharacterized protein Z519_10591 [Cladophialophora bantiana CBS 173.52]KIW88545.1 hypothetical protein Z519_10591 [Cladophialophora bantiana CBS 173.52]
MVQSEADEELTQDAPPTRKFTIISGTQSALQALIPGHLTTYGTTPPTSWRRRRSVHEEDHGFRHLASALKRTHRDKMLEEWRKEWCSADKGKHLRKIDSGLPSKRAQRLYGPLPRGRAYILTQLRTDHS